MISIQVCWSMQHNAWSPLSPFVEKCDAELYEKPIVSESVTAPETPC